MSLREIGGDVLRRMAQILDTFAMPIASGAIGLAAGHWLVIHSGEWFLQDVGWRSIILEHDALRWAIRCVAGALFFAVGWRFR